jgi:ribosomal protein L37E
MNDENAPGRCADCGDDAYIQLAQGDVFVCAHCFAGRATRRRPPSAAAPTAPPTELPVERAG